MIRFAPITYLVFLVASLSACAPHIEPPGDGRGLTPLLEERSARMDDGVRLPLTRYVSETEAPKAILLALHGFGDHSNAFKELGPDLAKQGIVTFAIDQRGFGKGPGHKYWHGHQRMVKDVISLTTVLKDTYPKQPLYILGESMGGAVALLAMTEPDMQADGVILSAPAVWGREWMWLVQSWGLDLLAHTMPWLPLEPKGIKIKPSDNIEMLKALSKDPLFIHTPRVDAVYGLVNLMDRAQEKAGELSKPVLVLYGERDELVPKEPTCAFLTALPEAAKARIALYPEGYHLLFRDLNGARVGRDIAAFTNDPSEALPSGQEVTLEGKRLSAFCNVG